LSEPYLRGPVDACGRGSVEKRDRKSDRTPEANLVRKKRVCGWVKEKEGQWKGEFCQAFQRENTPIKRNPPGGTQTRGGSSTKEEPGGNVKAQLLAKC